MIESRKWNFAEVQCQASKYKTKEEFRKKSGAYTVAKENGWLDILFLNNWTLEMVQAEAGKYKNRRTFYKGSKDAYIVARNRGWLNLCSFK